MLERKNTFFNKAICFICIIFTLSFASNASVGNCEDTISMIKNYECRYSVECTTAGGNKKLIAGGMPFGIKLFCDGVLISGVSEVDGIDGNTNPGMKAGLKAGDIIKKINGKDIFGISNVLESAYNSEGKTVRFTVMRGNKLFETDITPIKSKSNDNYSYGLWVKDGTSGIGTITYIDPQSLEFGGLGHGVCDSSSGKVLPMNNGKVNDVKISDVEKSKKGDPGELHGFLSGNDIGVIISNTEFGVFGVYNDIDISSCKAYTVGNKDELKEGPATILCTLSENNICEYEIKIEKINNNNEKTKNFIVKVTDKELLSETGGIVQGMSGSPIIQNGRLVGAVTHVLVDDPTRGYGIYIENMLNAS
ncbi:MAG: SpoIVB peptidase [Ruminococcaceae bacterium]|nr:SpoIVB peptidase [Oscillospiraceae bacterium]